MNRGVARWCLVLLMTACSRLYAVSFESSATPTQLIELYTAEGCSSCPPAERWLSALKHDDRLWRTLVPVAFHVDYWDSLGWPDVYAQPAFTTRQQATSTGTMYTPEFVVNGREWRGWFARESLPNATNNPGVLRVSLNDDDVLVVFTPNTGPNTGNTDFDAHVALLRSGLVADVTRGENSGRRLVHDFVVLGLSSTRLERQPEGYQAHSVLPKTGKLMPAELSIAAWVTRRGETIPLQAAGGWITAPASAE